MATKSSSPAPKPAAKASTPQSTGLPGLLHVGSGPAGAPAVRGFEAKAWSITRVDANPDAKPDLLASQTDLSAVASGSCQALLSRHTLQHLYPHEVPKALTEFVRVLNATGYAVLSCPNLKSLAELVAQDKLGQTAYTSPAGAVAAIDLLYGPRRALAAGQLALAHHCGFTLKVLLATLRAAGFASVAGIERAGPAHDLWVVASRSRLDNDALQALASRHFPMRSPAPKAA